jgi:hypothetical protein
MLFILPASCEMVEYLRLQEYSSDCELLLAPCAVVKGERK